MILRISENLIINIDEIRYIINGELCLKSGQIFMVDQRTVKNLQKIAEVHCKQFFGEGSKYE